MSFMNFLITGMGRSGTKFLATIMNKSPVWTVEHEPPGSEPWVALEEAHPFEVPPLEDLQARFNRDKYGEVNSYLRYVIHDLDVASKGVLLRNPRDIALSAYNRKYDEFASGKDPPEAQIQRVNAALKAVDRCVEAGMFVIRFERMVGDRDYLQQVLEEFGVDDYRVTEKDVNRRINPNPKVRFHRFAEIKDDYRSLVVSELEWFRQKYYGSEPWDVGA